jgi:hypothetical protein
LNAEEQLIEALPQTGAASRASAAGGLQESSRRKRAASSARRGLRQLSEKASGQDVRAMKGLLEEGQELMEGARQARSGRDADHGSAGQHCRSRLTAPSHLRRCGERGVARLMAPDAPPERQPDKKLTSVPGRRRRPPGRVRTSRHAHQGRAVDRIDRQVGDQKVMPRSAQRRGPRRGQMDAHESSRSRNR